MFPLFAAGPTTYASGAEAARRLFARSRVPDGVFCVTDLLAVGFMDVARHEFDLRVPEDLCIVGFDDIEEADWQAYRLTTFSQPLDEMADHVGGAHDRSERRRRGRRVFQPGAHLEEKW